MSSSFKARHSRGIKIHDTRFLAESTTHALTLAGHAVLPERAQHRHGIFHPAEYLDLGCMEHHKCCSRPDKEIFSFGLESSVLHVHPVLFFKVGCYGFQLPVEEILLHLPETKGSTVTFVQRHCLTMVMSSQLYKDHNRWTYLDRPWRIDRQAHVCQLV